MAGWRIEEGGEALEFIPRKALFLMCLIDRKSPNSAYFLNHIISRFLCIRIGFKKIEIYANGIEVQPFFADSLPAPTILGEKLEAPLCLINVSALIYFCQTPITSPFCQIHSL